ncbi:zinc finger protein 700-like [Ylistrum balloti]|uniref:zinc finger protein 700-like n=1 Tax=Ylistrum balloti TaxID=509963 RepID=UPI00290593E6|nr:zinc finger protein 700-like [Ylistrum balloti]
MKDHGLGGPSPKGSKFTSNMSCVSCGLCFSCVADLQSHSCEQALRVLEHEIQSSKSSLSTKELHCESCKMFFEDKTGKEQHDFVFHSHMGNSSGIDEVFNVCSLCGKEYHSQEAFRLHMLCHQPSDSSNNPKQTLQCKYCGKVFQFFSYLERHMHRHSFEKQKVCDYCGKSYKHQSDLNRHKRKNCVVAAMSGIETIS